MSIKRKGLGKGLDALLSAGLGVTAPAPDMPLVPGESDTKLEYKDGKLAHQIGRAHV